MKDYKNFKMRKKTNRLGKLSRDTMNINYSTLGFCLLRLADSKSLSFLREWHS